MKIKIKNNYKKFNVCFICLLLLTILLCSITLIGCSSNSNNATNNQAKNNVNSQTEIDTSKYKYIKDFEEMGLGIFIHFGLYSSVGKGEWYLNRNPEAKPEEYEKLTSTFDVDKNWAQELVQTAKNAGAKYITITTRHHDGFSLYDTCGLTNYDAPHSKCQRDLIREFVNACNANDIKPFFYHTLLDWHEPSYKDDFEKYLDYLYNSVKILCTNYGKIGGFWFDGSWDKPDADWHYDKLYNMIKSYQPDAMIINNTGLSEQGKVSHPLVDSVTYERGNPTFADNSDRPRAGEMCESMTDHWGYTKDDFSYKSVNKLIDTLLTCRQYNCNFLLNVGPMSNGLIGDYEKQTLGFIGQWIKYNKDFIYKIKKSEIEAENATIVKDDKHYYAIIKEVPMKSDPNVSKKSDKETIKINTDKKICNAKYLDNDDTQNIENNQFDVKAFAYGRSLYARILQFDLE